mmetsp:Transcript_26896/g.42210  ORF Transcript_26896/g.42210 Transcript_26896/m.42210 type:complete len:282 (+) Transcript_26896:127-972(+)
MVYLITLFASLLSILGQILVSGETCQTDRKLLHEEILDKYRNMAVLRSVQYNSTGGREMTSIPDCMIPRKSNFSLEIIPSLPYINMGMPKMGSSTLHTFWICGGLKASHYWCGKRDYLPNPCGPCMFSNVQRKKKIFDGCGDFDAYTEMNYVTHAPCIWPQAQYLNEIHDDKPDATFIIVFREIHSWISSLKRWREPDGTMLHQALGKKCGISGTGVELTDKVIEDFFCRHVARVRNFVNTHPSHKLVEVQLEDKETAQRMEQIFRIDSKCWRHMNQNFQH